MNPFAVEARIREFADRAATDFLSPLSEKRGSPEWIAKNAEEILKQSGKDLSQIIAKIASEENLNPHEVARVCEESNKEIFGRLYKSSDDKTFQFGVADANVILSLLNRPYDGPGDIFLPVEHPKMGSEKVASGKKSEPTSWASTALRPNEGQKLVMTLTEEKIANEALTELWWETQAEKHQGALDFIKMARNLVLEEGYELSNIFSMVKEARPDSKKHAEAARELLSVIAIETGKRFPEGADLVVKYATDLLSSETGGGEQPSDDLRNVTAEQYEFWTKSPGVKKEELISPLSSAGDPVRIINGRHALFISLDTLVNQTDKENWYGKGLLISGDRVRSVARNVVNWTHKSENVAI